MASKGVPSDPACLVEKANLMWVASVPPHLPPSHCHLAFQWPNAKQLSYKISMESSSTRASWVREIIFFNVLSSRWEKRVFLGEEKHCWLRWSYLVPNGLVSCSPEHSSFTQCGHFAWAFQAFYSLIINIVDIVQFFLNFFFFTF